ncbi:MAG: hypothetical protein QOG10_4303 [Kribbellaceae bacterium]|nr:hypothetical protein [Kribbellaceae bacterium]
MRILAWHVHGSWMTSFVSGNHQYLIPTLPARGEDGRGRGRTFDWPSTVVEISPDELEVAAIDLVLLQRPTELELFQKWSGRSLGEGGIPALYLEHNTPRGDVTDWVHPMAGRADIPIVHVSHFNQSMWDNGNAPTAVVEHGVPDYGPRYSGELESLAVVVNDPIRRWRITGMDLAARIAEQVPIHVYGMGTQDLDKHIRRGLAGVDNVSQAELHQRLPRHLAYLHPNRWTSVGMSLIEAMTLAMPVLVLSATAAPESVGPGAGLVSSNIDLLASQARWWSSQRHEAMTYGQAARAHALRRFALSRFLDDWDRLFTEAVHPPH